MSTRRHPVRGAFAGLLLGIGGALMVMMLGVVALTVTWLAIMSLVGLVLGVVFAYVTPARRQSSSTAQSSNT